MNVTNEFIKYSIHYDGGEDLKSSKENDLIRSRKILQLSPSGGSKEVILKYSLWTFPCLLMGFV